MPKPIEILVFLDGEDTNFLYPIVSKWISRWNEYYSHIGEIKFSHPINVKTQSGYNCLPEPLKDAFLIRNPDLFFIACVDSYQIPVGGLEITTHSPDGSNVEKRYPFIWAGRQYGYNAFIACPYMKKRHGGQINKLPNRHSQRNSDFLMEWSKSGRITTPLHQIIPIKELQESYGEATAVLKCDLLSIEDIADFYADFLAERLVPQSSTERILEFANKLAVLSKNCLNATTFTHPSTFFDTGTKWIQIYNTRPDSGHWERGEGQFDSIDGRLMFTLDEAVLKGIRREIEFWMPQLSRNHAWILEQIERDHGSKRIRNILVVLRGFIRTKFSDDLTPEDLEILRKNPSLTLERLDWQPGLYNIKELIGSNSISTIARQGMKAPSKSLVEGIESFLEMRDLYMSTRRLYEDDWLNKFLFDLDHTPEQSTIIAPRIPKTQIKEYINFGERSVIFAEDCTRFNLMALRQVHRLCF